MLVWVIQFKDGTYRKVIGADWCVNNEQEYVFIQGPRYHGTAILRIPIDSVKLVERREE